MGRLFAEMTGKASCSVNLDAPSLMKAGAGDGMPKQTAAHMSQLSGRYAD